MSESVSTFRAVGENQLKTPSMNPVHCLSPSRSPETGGQPDTVFGDVSGTVHARGSEG